MTNEETTDIAAEPVPEIPGRTLLRAELEALAMLLPGLLPALPGHKPPTEAEVEEGFDNMPV